jgi:predicted Ser/Thr protein kinase
MVPHRERVTVPSASASPAGSPHGSASGSASEAAPRSAPGEPLLAHDPTSVGPYVLVSRLGAGGMGTVYYARDPAGRPVAVKVIRPDRARDQEFRRRFRREVEAARAVASFCAAEVLDADPDAPAPYLVTEFIEGVRLDQAVERQGPLGPSTLTGLAVGVATALTAIHHAGLVHRDLKPSNVILSLTGPRVIDFGIAQVLEGSVAKPTGWRMGSAGWMAPEQLGGQPIGPAADVFTWGILVAYAATGRHPFGDGTAVNVAQRISAAEPDLTGLPRHLEDLVRLALAKDPARRPSAQDLLLRLVERRPGDHVTDPALRLLSLTEQMPPLTTATTRRRPRRGLIALIIGLVLLGAVAVAVGVAAVNIGGDAPAPVAGATPRPSASPGSGVFPDGGLRFSVDGVECGVRQLGDGFLARHPDGQFCMVTLTVRNTGTASSRLSYREQHAYDSTGGRHNADYMARFYLSGDTIWNTVEPGGSIHGRMVFDIPSTATLSRLDLHESPTSDGVSIPL